MYKLDTAGEVLVECGSRIGSYEVPSSVLCPVVGLVVNPLSVDGVLASSRSLHFPMLVQVVTPCKPFCAEITFKQFFASMNSLMALQVIRPCKYPGTGFILTTEGFFISMCSEVRREMIGF